jgi:SAM-dependent methyltransferase
MPSEDHRALVQQEFERAAPVFARRTMGRFDHLGAVEFSRVRPGALVAEVGAGTANFLSLFARTAAALIAVDVTHGMLRVATEMHEGISPVVGDGARLPIADRSIDLVSSAHALHHMPDPLPVVREMARVAGAGGSLLFVDIVAPEDPAEATRMDEVMTIRDPSHAAALAAGAFGTLLESAGLRVVDECLVDRTGLVSDWMWPGEFPPERIEAVRDYVQKHWRGLGMGIEPHGDDFTYRDRRMMMLASLA